MRSSDLKKIYNKEYFDKHRNNAGYKPSLRTFLNEVMKYHPKRVLDVGCGHGHLVEILLRIGVDAIGLDISEYAGEMIPGERFVVADVNEIPFEDNSFDVVCSKGVLEHIPEEEIERVYSEMKRVGKNIVVEICFKDKEADGHITIHPKDWWINKLPNCDIVDRTKVYGKRS